LGTHSDKVFAFAKYIVYTSGTMATPEIPAAPKPTQEPTPVPAPVPNAATSFRGPLRYEIEAESPQLEAGSPFTIFVRISNPYDIPVTIHGVSTLLPAEFRDPDAAPPSLGERFRRWSTDVEAPKAIYASTFSFTEGGAQPAASGPIVLQPGNTAIKKFAVKTRQVTLFSPALYTFHIEIHYEIDGKSNQDAVKQQFTIRAPLKALVYGSCWGAVAGASLHGLKDHLNNYAALWGIASVAAPISGILIGAVVVVAFARKKDSQPFISIEDFYGGCFVGFVAGYTGFPILDTILPK